MSGPAGVAAMICGAIPRKLGGTAAEWVSYVIQLSHQRCVPLAVVGLKAAEFWTWPSVQNLLRCGFTVVGGTCVDTGRARIPVRILLVKYRASFISLAVELPEAMCSHRSSSCFRKRSHGSSASPIAKLFCGAMPLHRQCYCRLR